MAGSAPSAFDAVLARMFQRDGVATLPAHLEAACGIPVKTMTRLDVGVFRVDRSDGGSPVVARLFAAARSQAAAEADLAVLRHLAEVGFPAERAVDGAALTTHEGQAVLVTELIEAAPKAEQPPHPILRLGARVGRLHGLAVPAGADRPAGALHHFAEGTMADELRATAGWLDAVEGKVPSGAAGAFDTIRAAVVAADGGDDLPEGFVHPDPVPSNAIFTADGPVLIDWTSAGRGPRLPSMTLVLRSGWAGVPFMKGYVRTASITDTERDRLAGLLFSRGLIDRVFRVCRDPDTIVSTARQLPALRRTTEARAAELLEVV